MIANAGTLRDVCLCSGTIYINGFCACCRKSQQSTQVCRCEGRLFINGECSACGGLLVYGGNNTVVGDGKNLTALQEKLRRNAQEFHALVAQLGTMSGVKRGRRSRGVFTKKILDKAEQRFPSGREYQRKPHQRCRQKR